MPKFQKVATVAAIDDIDWSRQDRVSELSSVSGLELFAYHPPMRRKELGIETLITGTVKEPGAQKLRISPTWFPSHDAALGAIRSLADAAPDASITVTISRRRRVEFE